MTILIEHRRTIVGTQDSFLSIASTPALFTWNFCVYMTLLAAMTLDWRSVSSTLTRVFLWVISLIMPRLWTRLSGIKHRGQGQAPRFRMVAISILFHIVYQWEKIMVSLSLTFQDSPRNMWISSGRIVVLSHRSIVLLCHASKHRWNHRREWLAIERGTALDDNVSWTQS